MHEIINKIMTPALSWEETLPDSMDISSKIALGREVDRIFFQINKNSAPVAHPQLKLVSGLPASGKSYLAEKLLKENPQYIYISFDRIMESISLYKESFKADKIRSFKSWEIPARGIGYYFLEKCVKGSFPILFEHSNALEEHLALLSCIKMPPYSYHLQIYHINATPELVFPRLSKRNRYFDVNRLPKIWKEIKRLKISYIEIADEFMELEAWKEP